MPVSVYALADLHLSNVSRDRYRMDRYGGPWVGHPENLIGRWRQTVPADALTLLPGDISLELKADDAVRDLQLIDRLPGFCKPMVKGNHDFGFGRSLSRWRAQCAPFASLLPLLGSAERVSTPEGDVIIAGTKGACTPEDPLFGVKVDDDTLELIPDPEMQAQDRKLYERELRLLTAALTEADRLRTGSEPLIVMLHFPPLTRDSTRTAFTELIEKAGAQLCVFGHVHGDRFHQFVFDGARNGTAYRFCAADWVNMTPRHVADVASGALQIM